MLWESLITGFKRFLILERALSKHTVEAYTRDIAVFSNYLKQTDGLKADEVTLSTVEAYLSSLYELNLSPRSIARMLSSLKTFYKYLLVERILVLDPTTKVLSPKLPSQLPKYLSIDEINNILEGVDLSHENGTRNRAILEVLYACGLRVSELTGLVISNLRFEDDLIKVVGKGNKERWIPIGKSAQRQVSLYLQHVRRTQKNINDQARDIVFLNRRGKALSRVMIYHIVRDSAQVAGINRKVSPHMFRHSFATHLVEGGADIRAVQEMLGHTSILTTEIYTHVGKRYLRDNILNYHPHRHTSIS